MSYIGPCEYKFFKKVKKKAKVKRRKDKITGKEEDGKCLNISEQGSQVLSFQSFSNFYRDSALACGDVDCDSEPDRSNPLWKIVPEKKECEEIKEDTSTDAAKDKPSIWDEIMTEYEDEREEYNNLLNLMKPYEPELPVCSKLSATQYLEKYIFPLLCPALEETLFKAKEWECLMIQKCRFNGLDYIAELLWNRNPLHPRRHGKHRDIFDIPFVIIWLYYNPRPIYPLSWLWTQDEAITILQKYIRRYKVCKDTECSEMRQFWKTLKREKEEERQAKRENSIQNLEALFNQIFYRLISEAVYQAEWKKYGCRCIKTPCHCVCKCKKWCKCCDCFKIPPHNGASCSCSKLYNI